MIPRDWALVAAGYAAARRASEGPRAGDNAPSRARTLELFEDLRRRRAAAAAGG